MIEHVGQRDTDCATCSAKESKTHQLCHAYCDHLDPGVPNTFVAQYFARGTSIVYERIWHESGRHF